MHHGGHGSTPAQGVSARGLPSMRPSCESQFPAVTIDSVQSGHGWHPSWSSSSRTDILRSLCLPDQAPRISSRDQVVAVGVDVSCRQPVSSHSRGEISHLSLATLIINRIMISQVTKNGLLAFVGLKTVSKTFLNVS